LSHIQSFHTFSPCTFWQKKEKKKKQSTIKRQNFSHHKRAMIPVGWQWEVAWMKHGGFKEWNYFL
jgi:hypothetical protein